MRIGLAQLNPIVGDLQGNAAAILDAARAAAAEGADFVVTSELSLTGYPLRDLILREGFVEQCEAMVVEIARSAPPIPLLVGHPSRAEGVRPFHNSISVCRDGIVAARYDKRLLPTYDVFDEDRYFEPGSRPTVFDVAGTRVAVLVCEDLWRADDVTAQRRYVIDPLRESVALGAQVVLVPSASPFVVGKRAVHLRQLAKAAKSLGVAIVSVNQVGANDDVIFDGGSAVIDASGRPLASLDLWKSQLRVVDVRAIAEVAPQEPSVDETLFEALTLGIRDYVRKTGHARVLVGLSGGIDSALVATLAAAAVGPGNVRGITMPSRYSSAGSVEDSAQLARNLHLGQFDNVTIEASHAAVAASLAGVQTSATSGIADENAQARLRCVLLMSIANATGALVLATGNKSELATGYCTLYGDMCGALAVLGDVLKSRVWSLSRWINAHHRRCGFDVPPIPVSSIEKPPSAELRPNQTDQETLPPYHLLDQIVERYIDLEQSVSTIARETGIDEPTVRRWARTIDANEYKRAQAALVLKVSQRSFGPGRRYPLAMRLS